MLYSFTSHSAADTQLFAQQIGERLKGGELIELVSDLGGGKTTFMGGLAKGIGSKDEVSSPSYTLNNRYTGTRLSIEHFDFYRLRTAGVVAEELLEYVGDPSVVVAVEWGDIVHDVLPAARVTITIRVSGENSREITCEYPASHSYLFGGKL